MATIPASAIVNVTPSVLAAAGAALNLNGLFLTTNTRVPIGSVLSFPSSSSVSNYFGASSTEAAAAAVYFNGFSISTVKPGALLFTQYNSTAVAAYIRGGNAAGLTLTQLQAINGTLNIVVDGIARTGSVNLSGAASFSAAATLIQTALNTGLATIASITASISGTTLTVTNVASGSLAAGQNLVDGTAVTATTVIISQISGAVGGTGTYQLSATNGSIGSSAMTTQAAAIVATYDSVSGGFIITSGAGPAGAASTIAYATGGIAASLFLTQATGAVLSQGAAATTPSAFMTGVVAITQNWASFKTLFDPDGGSGNAQKLLFATWNGQQNNRYCYVTADTDITPTLSTQATGSLGYLLAQASISGTCLIYEPSTGGPYHIADFVCGAIASLNFNQNNGRADFAFLSQSGLVATVTSQTVMANLIANGYNFYGAYGTANQNFIFFYPGSVSGPFSWLDTYVNQIWLNNAFQLALMELLTSALSIPYNSAGNSLIEAALGSPIAAGLKYGAFRAGVTLSASQIAAVNNQAGNTTAANTIQNRGWYLQIGTASATVRQARGSPPMTFWYADGEDVQSINLASIVLQ